MSKQKGGTLYTMDNDANSNGREEQFMDIDRMVNEGLGGGQVTLHNGLVEDSTTDTMDDKETILNEINQAHSQPQSNKKP